MSTFEQQQSSNVGHVCGQGCRHLLDRKDHHLMSENTPHKGQQVRQGGDTCYQKHQRLLICRAGGPSGLLPACASCQEGSLAMQLIHQLQQACLSCEHNLFGRCRRQEISYQRLALALGIFARMLQSLAIHKDLLGHLLWSSNGLHLMPEPGEVSGSKTAVERSRPSAMSYKACQAWTGSKLTLLRNALQESIVLHCNKSFPMMRRLFDAAVKSTRSYGCEVWVPFDLTTCSQG